MLLRELGLPKEPSGMWVGQVMECCASSPAFNPVEHFGISSDVLSAHQWLTATTVAKLRQILVEELDARGLEGHMWPALGRGRFHDLLLKLHILLSSTNKCFGFVLWKCELQNVNSVNYLLIRNGNKADPSHPLWLRWSWYKSIVSYKCQIVDTVLESLNTSVFQGRHKLDVKPFANIKSLCSPYRTFPIKDVLWKCCETKQYKPYNM